MSDKPTFEGLTLTRTYEGRRFGDGRVSVHVDGWPLSLHTDAVCYAQHFDWGEDGLEGGRQLAVAILYDMSKDRAFARKHADELAERMVRSLDYGGWRKSGAEIADRLPRGTAKVNKPPSNAGRPRKKKVTLEADEEA